MKVELISHTVSSRKLMLIFAGWSTSPRFYSDINLKGWDVAVVWDYSDLTLDLNSLTRQYATVFVVAWSLGVAAAECLAHSGGISPADIAAAFAVNGTPHPVSDLHGIPEAIYDGTERTLNEPNLRRFLRRMATSRDLFHPFPADQISSEINIDSLRLQLRTLRDIHHTPSLPWLRAYISENDLIFPAKAQTAYWNEAKVDYVTLPSGHYIPLSFITSRVTPDLERIGRRFGSATEYDRYATAQHKIADHLADMIPEDTTTNGNILEIGSGSGYFSRRLADKLLPQEMTLLDLYPTPHLNIAPIETHIAEDAEVFMENCHSSTYDVIASANTIQWFADPHKFFHNAARALRPRGIFVCSTFLPGNLNELDILRPTPLLYRSKEWLKEALEECFRNVSVTEEDITLHFESRRALMLHLHHTGVAGSSNSAKISWTNLPEKPTLTYRPAYIIAQVK